MKCVIPGANVKILARAIHAMSKIGEEIYVQPQLKALSFRAVSLSNSAYIDFTFRDNYFCYYNYGNLDEDEALKCKVGVRGLIAVFKNPGIIEKLVETCHIKLESNAEKLVMILKYKNGVIKTFLLTIIDTEHLQAGYNKDGPNRLTVQPKTLVEALHNFQQTLIEITLDVTKEKILMRNYIDEDTTVVATRTQLALTIGEFDTYSIGQDAVITFCLKELRALLAFAEQVAIPIHILFEDAGKPVVFVLKHISFEGNLVLSTLNPDVQTLPDTSVRDKRARMLKKRAPIKRASKALTKSKNSSSRSSISTASTSSIVSSILNKDKNLSRTLQAEKRTVNVDKHNEISLAAVLRSTSIESPSNNVGIPERPTTPMIENEERMDIVQETPSSSGTSSSCSTVIPPQIPAIFTVARRTRKNSQFEEENRNSPQKNDFDETVPDSPPPPPPKRAKTIFKKCFQATFDPRMLPGHDEVLADDSDENS